MCQEQAVQNQGGKNRMKSFSIWSPEVEHISLFLWFMS